MSYSPDLIEIFRRAAVFVDKILKGAKPADLCGCWTREFTHLDLALSLLRIGGIYFIDDLLP